MKIELNGKPVELAPGATVADAVIPAGAGAGDSRGVAVAVDGEVIRRADWGMTELKSDQSVEVVRAVQGG
jgi:sulfur carrier protein